MWACHVARVAAPIRHEQQSPRYPCALSRALTLGNSLRLRPRSPRGRHSTRQPGHAWLVRPTAAPRHSRSYPRHGGGRRTWCGTFRSRDGAILMGDARPAVSGQFGRRDAVAHGRGRLGARERRGCGRSGGGWYRRSDRRFGCGGNGIAGLSKEGARARVETRSERWRLGESVPEEEDLRWREGGVGQLKARWTRCQSHRRDVRGGQVVAGSCLPHREDATKSRCVARASAGDLDREP